MKIEEIKVLRGPNYWSVRRPKLIQMKLDLEEMEEKPSNKIPDFKENLEISLDAVKTSSKRLPLNNPSFK